MQRFATVVAAFILAGWAFIVSSDLVAAQTITRDGDDRSIVPIVIVGLLLCGAIFLVWLTYRDNKPFRGSRVSTLDQSDGLRRVVERFTVDGWHVTSREGGTVTFAKRINPDWSTTFVLALFAVFPAIIYLLIGGKDLTATVHARPGPDATTDVDIVGNAQGYGARRTAARALDSL